VETEESPKEFKENSHAVQSHLTIIQSVIQRMAINSASVKAWCIALVSALLVVIADKNKPDLVYIGLLPTILFFALDTYYLAHEKGIRASYNRFIKKLHSGKIEADDLFVVAPSGSMKAHIWASITSFSILPFYLGIVLMLLMARCMAL